MEINFLTRTYIYDRLCKVTLYMITCFAHKQHQNKVFVIQKYKWK